MLTPVSTTATVIGLPSGGPRRREGTDNSVDRMADLLLRTTLRGESGLARWSIPASYVVEYGHEFVAVIGFG